MAASDYLENMILDSIFGTGTFSEPATVYVALYTTDPTDADTGTEASGGAYARVGLATDGSNWTAVNNNTWQNAADIAFPESTAAWGTVTHVGLRTAATGGNLLFSAALATARTVDDAGITIRIPAGSLTVSLD